MHIKEVIVERVKNLGNYENERLALTVALDKGDNAAKAVLEARRFINAQQAPLPVRPTKK